MLLRVEANKEGGHVDNLLAHTVARKGVGRGSGELNVSVLQAGFAREDVLCSGPHAKIADAASITGSH